MASDTTHIFSLNNICTGISAHLYSEEQSYRMLLIGLDLLSSFSTKMWHVQNVWLLDLKAIRYKYLFNSGCSEISSNLFKTFLIGYHLYWKVCLLFVDPIKNSRKHLPHSLCKFLPKSLFLSFDLISLSF